MGRVPIVRRVGSRRRVSSRCSRPAAHLPRRLEPHRPPQIVPPRPPRRRAGPPPTPVAGTVRAAAADATRAGRPRLPSRRSTCRSRWPSACSPAPVTDWAELGAPAGAAAGGRVAGGRGGGAGAAGRVERRTRSRAAQGDLGVIAVLPAPVVGPTVRVLTVGGVDPFRDPGRVRADHRRAGSRQRRHDVVRRRLMLARGVGRRDRGRGRSGRTAAADRRPAGRRGRHDRHVREHAVPDRAADPGRRLVRRRSERARRA